MTERRPARKYPPGLKARALELLATLPPAKARRALAEELDLPLDELPNAATLRTWRHKAGVMRTDPESPPADPDAAKVARLEELAAARDDLSEALIRRLSQPAASALVRRLERNLAAEDLVDNVLVRWKDALVMEALAADEGPDAARAAKRVTAGILAELEAAERLLIPARNLVGILTRGVADHMALEGLAAADGMGGDLIVELMVPDPVHTDPTAAHELDEVADA